MCDLDHFKKFNDSLGHLAGDNALRTVAQIISKQCRTSDSVYRYGGEELAVIMTAQSLQAAGTAMERIRRAVELRALEHPASPTAPYLTISIGVAARRSGDAKDGRDVLNRADAALYRAKSGGRNRVALAEE
jgi:diguanylate cyclase (GGDEF)-like protein